MLGLQVLAATWGSYKDAEDSSSGPVLAKSAVDPQSHLPRPDQMILIVSQSLLASIGDQFL